MFENVIGLNGVVQDIRISVARETLPASLLFHGSRYSGKGTVALELARVLSCREGASWDCSCRSCALHRTLTHPDIALVGPRYFSQEIAAAMHAFEKEPRKGTFFLVLRAVRKLVRRFDQHLWAENRVKKVLPLVDAVEEVLQDAEEYLAGDALPADMMKLVRPVSRLVAAIPHDIVPVDLIRNLSSWAHMSSTGSVKVVLVEEAHTLQEGARNSMLKILEEPPADVWFILTTTRRSAVIPTLLSRLRPVAFPDRSSSDQQRVLQQIFRITPAPADDLDHFFRSVPGAQTQPWADLADRLVTITRKSRPEEVLAALHMLRTCMQEGNGRSNGELLLEEMSARLRRDLSSAAGANSREVHRKNEVVRQSRERIVTRNMNPLGVLSDLILALREGSAA